MHGGLAHSSPGLWIAEEARIAIAVMKSHLDDRGRHFVAEQAAVNLRVATAIGHTGAIIPCDFKRGNTQCNQIVIHFLARELRQL
ncbi:hypothetical protein SDC9_173486 [bioreactor metagenome]|uniref:Uncharacterized protein n=1 Tax=bioreactor metagenome TaxID=1076179 RepID=A0A645GQ26_9ZZZZ